MKAYIVNNGTSYAGQLQELLGSYDVVLKNFDEVSLREIEPGSLVVLSGGHILKVQWHNKQYAKEIEIIREYEGPIVGVCLGAQLIAHAYGEHLHAMAKNHKGIIKIHAADTSNTLFEGSKEVNVYENHHLSITILHLPLVSLAESADGVEVFRHIDKPIYGLQFHPEILKHNNGKSLFVDILSSLNS